MATEVPVHDVTPDDEADPRAELRNAMWSFLGVLVFVALGCVQRFWWETASGGVPAFAAGLAWLVVAGWRLVSWRRLRRGRGR
ncbi:hypothetical protein [Cellulomonas xiejunii]|uniref:DUF2530 domain-containing protein n=1 Tax=Cellulomonas xiejunii TaxID=2968083 RepID=A0ABY5KN08_9CELL|nr:hypothetical protein [Cellulomonas xiejunii]MCC2321281.1 hypothetical protein [Cellulomonas xiejunii]UUI71869.1 hypothetical protein NP048_19115 [Cellulomonas xiejunii]